MDESVPSWEDVLENQSVNEWDKKPSNYIKINGSDPKYSDYTHCSHVFIYARTNSTSYEENERKALILMQIRSDGFLGFPGGYVDPGETPVEAVNRELREESGWFEDSGPVTQEHYLFAHANEERKMVHNFFAIEVSEEKIKEIEATTLQAIHFGDEVLGTCRVPLYTKKDKYSGFPAFLRNNFVGNSKAQLIETLVTLKFLSAENVVQALIIKPLKFS